MFAEHRAEVSRFAASITGDSLGFVAMSYPELWKCWEETASPDLLPTHIARLRSRYGVTA